jgi:hypothetical protein
MALLKRLAVASLIIVGGCTRPADPLSFTEPHHSIHSLLVGGATEVSVLVRHFDPRTRISSFAPAEMVLVGPAETVALTVAPSAHRCSRGLPAEPLVGCYAADLEQPIQPGDVWELFIRFPDGTEASGVARVPPAPVLRSPDEGERVVLENGGRPRFLGDFVGSVQLRWDLHEAIGGGGATLDPTHVWTASPTGENGCRIWAPTTGPPFSVQSSRTGYDIPIYDVWCGEGDASVQWDSMRVRLKALAFDTAYVRYASLVLEGDAVREEFAAAGLSGAYGFFASASTAERTLLFVPEP